MVCGKKMERLILSIVRLLSSCEQDALSEVLYLLKDYLVYESALIMDISSGRELYSDSDFFNEGMKKKIVSKCNQGVYFDGVSIYKAPTYQVVSYRLSDDISFPYILSLKLGNSFKPIKDMVLLLRLIGLAVRLHNTFGLAAMTYVDALSGVGTRDALYLYLEKEATKGDVMVWWEINSCEKMCEKLGVEKVHGVISAMAEILKDNFHSVYRVSVGGFVALYKQSASLYDACGLIQRSMDLFYEKYREYQTAALLVALQGDFLEALHLCEKKIQTASVDSVTVIHDGGWQDVIYEEVAPSAEEASTKDILSDEISSEQNERDSDVVYEVWDDE